MKIKSYINFALTGKNSTDALEESQEMLAALALEKIQLVESEAIVPSIKESTDTEVTMADIGFVYEDGFDDGYKAAMNRQPKVKIVDGRRFLDKLTEEEMSAAVLNDKNYAKKEREKSRIEQVKQIKAVKLGTAANTKSPEVPGGCVDGGEVEA